jgi:hypothetical protein
MNERVARRTEPEAGEMGVEIAEQKRRLKKQQACIPNRRTAPGEW